MHTLRFAAWLLAAVLLTAAEPLVWIPPVRTAGEIGGQPVSIAASGEVSAAEHPHLYAIFAGGGSERPAGARDRHHGRWTGPLRGVRPEAAHSRRNAGSGESDCGAAGERFEQWACAKVMGKNVIKRLVAGDGSIEADLKPTLEGTAGAGVVAEVREVQADGSLGDMLRSGSLGTAVREKVRASVQKALDKVTDYRATLPPTIQNVLRLRGMRFGDAGGGRLALALEAEAEISGEQLQLLRTEAGRSR